MERKIRANIAYGNGEYSEAESQLVDFLHDYPYDSTAWEMLGLVRDKMNKKELSSCAFEMVKLLQGMA